MQSWTLYTVDEDYVVAFKILDNQLRNGELVTVTYSGMTMVLSSSSGSDDVIHDDVIYTDAGAVLRYDALGGQQMDSCGFVLQIILAGKCICSQLHHPKSEVMEIQCLPTASELWEFG